MALLNVLRVYLLSSISWQALANTEIINFPATEEVDANIPLAAEWSVLDHARNEGRWNVAPAPLYAALNTVCEPLQEPHTCPHELWFTLDLTSTEWKKYSKFTLRLSWPASFPADFLAEVYDPRKALEHHSLYLNLSSAGSESQLQPSRSSTRLKYARIRVVDTGVPTPSLPASSSSKSPEPVPFILILEPLHFGVLPASVVPVLLFLILVIGLAGCTVPWITRYLDEVAQLAREEIDGMEKKKE